MLYEHLSSKSQGDVTQQPMLFEQELESVDEVEIIRRMEENIYDEAEYQIKVAVQEKFEDMYDGIVVDARIYVKKVYRNIVKNSTIFINAHNFKKAKLLDIFIRWSEAQLYRHEFSGEGRMLNIQGP